MSEVARNASSVSIAEVTKTYRSRGAQVHALGPISLVIRESEFVSIVGPSGCGKTTLLMITAGLLPPSTGRVTIGTTPVTKPVTNSGVVFQNPALLDWRTSIGNVLLQAEARGLDMTQARRSAAALLQQVGLAGFENLHPYELSGGMRQRVALCRAVIHEPSLLLMDEPFGAVDAITRTQLGLDLQRMWMKRPTTVMFVTHGIAEAVFLSDRVVVMSDRPGRIDGIVEVNLERPRDTDVQQNPEYLRAIGSIEALFHARGILRG